jgi:hypothetical protein
VLARGVDLPEGHHMLVASGRKLKPLRTAGCLAADLGSESHYTQGTRSILASSEVRESSRLEEPSSA